METIVYRKMMKDDEAFIFSTYLKNNWYDDSNNTTLKKDTWFRTQHARMSRLLETTPVVIACLSSDPDVILGYALQDHSPFVYIRPSWRDEALNLKEKLLVNLKETK